MSTIQQDLQAYCRDLAVAAQAAAQELALIPTDLRNHWLRESASQLQQQADRLLAANAEDIAAAPSYGLSEAQIDRLRLDAERIDGIAEGLRQVASLDDPVGEQIDHTTRPNGLEISRVRVPLGVVFFIYESRPNVTADAAAICIKSGNAVILRGGKEAAHSSRAIVEVLAEVAQQVGIPPAAMQLVASSDRDAVGHFLAMNDQIDLAIPRGGEGLIRRVASEATMPVIKHFTGNCHVFVDQSADLEMAREITINAKCQRMGVCNACESLLVHRQVAEQFLPQLGTALAENEIEVRGDEMTQQLVTDAVAVSDADYSCEFLGPVISVRVVESIDEAIAHINKYGSQHTDAIVTQDEGAAEKFAAEVDTAAVMVNASTRFHDGGEFGLGAEIGISTDKFHARGPCGLRELTSYKYICRGTGQIRG